MIPHPLIFPRVLLVLLVVAAAIAASDPAPKTPGTADVPSASNIGPHPLAWDALEKTIDAKPDETAVRFEFNVTNTSKDSVEIVQIRPSCGCTVAEMPSTPWVLQPGAKGAFTAVVDIRGKQGKLSKMLFVDTTAGAQTLGMIINIPEPEVDRRRENQLLAFVDRQAIFRGDCASCHVAPTVGKTGEELFQSACAICHLANPRATMVPDLMAVREPRDAAYWQKWISEGRERTLMPAFARQHGGPLTAEQITTLVEYALKRLPTEVQKN